MLLVRLIDLYSLVIVAAVVVSWTNLPRDNPVVRFLYAVTEPVLEPIRRVLPELGGIDFSPVVVIVVLRLVAGIL
jgi:YggT family protein